MFDSTNFCTFEVMDGAKVQLVSSQNPLHPAEHAISPLEPNMAWETNGDSEQHILTIILPETKSVDGFLFIPHETDTLLLSIEISVESSGDGADWSSVSTEELRDYGPPYQIKLRRFVNAISARYWRFTVSSAVAFGGNYIIGDAPDDTRISALWLFTSHELDCGAILPINDQTSFSNNEIQLPAGKQFTTGYGANSSININRSWAVNDAQRDILWSVIRNCNGIFRPFLFIDLDGTRHLCTLASNSISETVLDIGLFRLEWSAIGIPIIKMDKYH